MSTNDQTPHLAAIFTHLQALIGDIVDTKISERIASSGGLVCSHCSHNCSSKVTKSESLMMRSSNCNPESKNVDSTHFLEDLYVNFELKMSKLQSALQQTVNNQQKLESTDCDKPGSIVEFEKRIIELTKQHACVEVKTEQLQSDFVNLTSLHSVAVDKHEVLSTLVSNIGHEHNELFEFVRELSQSTVSADQLIELKAIVECMARVTKVSEHKAEQLIKEFIGKESAELEHVKRELRLADDRIRELQLARDQMATMHDSACHNQLPYLKLVTEAMQRECERYKDELNAMADSLSERVNAKLAQAIQQSLVDKHQPNNETQIGSTEDQDIKPRTLVSIRSSSQISTKRQQPVADDGGTVIEAVSTAALEDETELKRHQDAHTQVKHTAVNSPKPSATMRAETSPENSDLKTDFNASETVLESETTFKMVAEPSSEQNSATITQQQQLRLDDSQPSPISTSLVYSHFEHAETPRSMSDQYRYGRYVFKCVVAGHESAHTNELLQAYVDKLSSNGAIYSKTSVRTVADIRIKNGTVQKLYLFTTNCTKAKNLLSITCCNIIVICFSVINQISYNDVQNVWPKQIKQQFPKSPYLLVGTQIDKRQKDGVKHNFQVDYEQGLQLSQEIGAVAYFECSHSVVDSVDTMFMYALQYAVDNTVPYLCYD